MKRKKIGFTSIELLTVLAIVALLAGLLLPAISVVRRTARETKQKAQLTTIELALTAFKNDYGDYPPSDGWDYVASAPLNYCGAQKLAEALLGRDLLGFNKYSNWSSTDLTYYPTDRVALDASLNNRKGPYLELATTNVFRLGITNEHDGLFADTLVLNPDRYVICDSFAVKKITQMINTPIGPKPVSFNAGTPILYYKADTRSKRLGQSPTNAKDTIYDYRDNGFLVSLGRLVDWQKPQANRRRHKLEDFAIFYSADGGVVDPKVTATPWPYRPDSYILISAGADGFYGTGDDIRNFKD